MHLWKLVLVTGAVASLSGRPPKEIPPFPVEPLPNTCAAKDCVSPKFDIGTCTKVCPSGGQSFPGRCCTSDSTCTCCVYCQETECKYTGKYGTQYGTCRLESMGCSGTWGNICQNHNPFLPNSHSCRCCLKDLEPRIELIACTASSSTDSTSVTIGPPSELPSSAEMTETISTVESTITTQPYPETSEIPQLETTSGSEASISDTLIDVLFTGTPSRQTTRTIAATESPSATPTCGGECSNDNNDEGTCSTTCRAGAPAPGHCPGPANCKCCVSCNPGNGCSDPATGLHGDCRLNSKKCAEGYFVDTCNGFAQDSGSCLCCVTTSKHSAVATSLPSITSTIPVTPSTTQTPGGDSELLPTQSLPPVPSTSCPAHCTNSEGEKGTCRQLSAPEWACQGTFWWGPGTTGCGDGDCACCVPFQSTTALPTTMETSPSHLTSSTIG